MIFAKFEFNNEAEFEAAAAGILHAGYDLSQPNIQGIDCSISPNLPIELHPAVLNDEGEVVTPAEMSPKYHVDISFGDSYGQPTDDLPEVLAPFEVLPEPIGQHTFMAMEQVYEARYNARHTA
ncbi:MAG: hypothetical protein C0424_10375 [Sphingobacteriaceae bacterium]|nr:hypothetical protein [Sphingobacteriaceae bacterium]